MSPQLEAVGSVSWLLLQEKKNGLTGACGEGERLGVRGSERQRETQQDSAQRFILFSSSSLCLAEDSVSCENPGLPDNGYQIMSKSLYLPGQSLTFVCYQGYELIGEVAIKCILGNPSFWSGPLPLCRGEIFADSFLCGMCFVCVDWEVIAQPSFSLWATRPLHVLYVFQKKDIITRLGCMLAKYFPV